MNFAPPLVAILFDLDETLCRTSGYFFWEIVRLALRALAAGPVRPFRLLHLLRTFRKVRESLRADIAVHDLHHTQFELTARRLGVPIEDVTEVVRPLIYDRLFPGLDAYCEPGLEETLVALKSRGFKLGVLSDYPVGRKLAGMGLTDVGWDVLLSAEDVDALKPQAPLFLRALEKLELEPPRALYVGDRPDIDVTGARALGMRSCLIRRWGRTAPDADLVVGRLSELLTRLG